MTAPAPLASATPRELAALGCYWLDLRCLRTATGRAATERIEVSAEGYTITRVTPDVTSSDDAHDTSSTSSTSNASDTYTVEQYTLPHGFSGGRARVTVSTARPRPRLTIEEAL